MNLQILTGLLALDPEPYLAFIVKFENVFEDGTFLKELFAYVGLYGSKDLEEVNIIDLRVSHYIFQ